MTQNLWLGMAALLSLIALGLLAWWLVRRRRRLDYLLRRIAWERLADVIIPDDVEGEIHLDLALLTPRGILVLEVRRGNGTLFWSEQMEHWTVLDGTGRTVLKNPLPGMRARRHAVHALVPRVPVDGRVVFVGELSIAGERPPGVLLPEDLVTEFPARGKEGPPPALREAWATLVAAARPL